MSQRCRPNVVAAFQFQTFQPSPLSSPATREDEGGGWNHWNDWNVWNGSAATKIRAWTTGVNP